ncbi:MAG: hypothetical protein IKK08_03675 [Clostridia bacterium]|nr:hypothetical protein [Clostridia bacterium]
MAVRDWVCTICTAQNQPDESSCRVCGTDRRTSEKKLQEKTRKKPAASAGRAKAEKPPKVKPEKPPRVKTEKPPRVKAEKPPKAKPEKPAKAKPEKKPVKTDGRAPVILSGGVSPRVVTLARWTNAVWYVVAAFTILQWIFCMTLPEMFDRPEAMLDCFGEFSVGDFFPALWRGITGVVGKIAENFSLASPLIVWNRAMGILGSVPGNVLASQVLAISGAWALRLLVFGVMESDERISLRRPNRAGFTIVFVDLLAIVLALLFRSAGVGSVIVEMALVLFTLQTAGMLLVLACYVLVGAFTKLNMSRVILKSCVALALLWFLAGCIGCAL